MQCEEVRNRLADYLRGDLAGSARAEWRRHLTSCAACRAETDALEDVWAALNEIPADRADPIAMRTRFDEMLDAQQPWPVRSPAVSVWDSIGTWMGAVGSPRVLVRAGAAAALLLVGAMAGRVAFPPALQPNSDLTELRRELRDVREMLTLSLMQQSSATDRLRGVGGSGQIDQPGGEIVAALLDTLQHDPNVNVRLATVDALRRFSEQPIVRSGAARALTDAPSPLVQIALIDFVVETKDAEAVGALRRLSQDATANDAVRRRAVWGLGQLSS